MDRPENTRQHRLFIDLFSGCGGLALGLVNAGWTGLFAVEKDPWAFETLKHNLVDNEDSSFLWPSWLPKKSMTVESLLKNHADKLRSLRGQISLISGGPPCQGFSNAGRRNPADPRNRLTEQYIRVVKLVRPRMLLLENVLGFNTPFKKAEIAEGEGNDETSALAQVAYSEIVRKKLEQLGYRTYARSIASFRWGVPQLRPRFILVAVLADQDTEDKPAEDPLEFIEASRNPFLARKGLPRGKAVTVSQAIGDLTVGGKTLVPVEDGGRSGYLQICYTAPTRLNGYLKLMRDKMDNKMSPNSLRLTRHRFETMDRFKTIIRQCTPGRCLSPDERAQLGIKKQAITLLAANKPSATITTLPDDIVHYSEPRILTVRENARLQSFPDWFEFKGQYTTGGKQRTQSCPRYTQVGNAVPPLLAEGIGSALGELIDGWREAIHDI